jgi:hypothetical protein
MSLLTKIAAIFRPSEAREAPLHIVWPRDSRGRYIRFAGPGLICERCKYPLDGATCRAIHRWEVQP